jgi:hypothetical protein
MPSSGITIQKSCIEFQKGTNSANVMGRVNIETEN